MGEPLSSPREILTPLHEATLAALNALDRFYQRHKNQHRVACWWTQLGILRRSLHRLVNALDSYEEHSALSRKASASRKKPSSKSTASELRLRDVAVERASWVNDTILPRAFIAFTQLAADQQHASLGLFLIGLVGFLGNSLAPLSTSPKSRGPPTATSALAVQTAQVNATNSIDGMDLGVVVSRADVEVTPQQSSETRPIVAVQSTTHDGDDTPCSRGPKATTSSTSNELISPGKPDGMKKSQKRTQPSDSKPKDPKPKKKRKKGDEFANLFGSLL